MRIPRLFFAGALPHKEIVVGENEYRHLISVLRRSKGDTVEVGDGNGEMYQGVISEVDPGRKIIKIQLGDKSLERIPELSSMRVAVGIAKGDAIEVAIRFGSETGLNVLQPLITERTISKPKDGSKKFERWQRIAKESAEQCRRQVPLRVEPPQSFNEFLSARQESDELSASWLAVPGGSTLKGSGVLNALGPWQDHSRGPWVLIGPEGGWSPRELERTQELGLRTLGFPGPVMKTSTAVIFLGALSSLRGEVS